MGERSPSALRPWRSASAGRGPRTARRSPSRVRTVRSRSSTGQRTSWETPSRTRGGASPARPPPPTTASDHADGPYDAGTTFAFHATDVGSGVARTEVRVDGGAWATYAAPLALAAGAHTIRFRSVDHLNNTEAERTLSVTIEGAPPPPPETNWKP